MPLPQMTPEQRAAALEKAAAARKARADVRARIKSGDVPLSELIEETPIDDVVGRMKVSVLLQTVPGVGKVRAAQIMGRHKIAENRRVRGLGPAQRKALAADLTAAGN